MTETAAPPVGPTPGAGPVPTLAKKAKPQKAPGERRLLAWLFLAPALILLAAILLYPMVYSIVRSLFGDGPAGTTGSFVGFKNYGSVFTDSDTLRSVKNNIIWVVVAPTLITIFGLIFAVLSERIRWATVFKTVLFMPMAISGLAVGVTFALIYSDQPSRGLANAVTVGIHDLFSTSSGYPTEHVRDTSVFSGSPSKGYTSVKTFSPGTPALLPMVGIDLANPPKGLQSAALPSGGTGLSGVVWNDFKLGGGGTIGKPDPGELGLKDVTVQAVQNGKVVASATTNASGQFTFGKLTSGSYQLRLPASNFGQPYTGFSWLGSTLITPAIILAYLWIYSGFAMVLLAAGMSAIPRDALEAARIDGATEWQVFRRITAPLLAPVLVVVLVTLIINVLKVFDVVFIIGQSAGGNSKYASVLAVQLFDSYGEQKYGIASAIGVLLVLLVVPAMIFNVRRFRRENR
jgi:ABC-type sugar transport system permease subunit